MIDTPEEPVAPAPITPVLLERLRRELGDSTVLSAPGEVEPYRTDAMPLYRSTPGFVLRPPDAATAVRAVKLLAQETIPWAARGAGTGLSGGALAPEGGAVVSLARLRRIVRIDPRARRARVEAGVVNLELDRALAPLGMAFAPDPSSQSVSTIGGNVAENAGGPHTLKYGVTSAHVTGLRIVLGDGAVIELGGDEETMGGYDLIGLLAGSEGTLGLALEATVRLTPLPPATRTFLAAFPSVPAACRAVSAILQAGVVPAALEMIDSVVLETLEAAFHAGFPLDAGALLVGDLDGSAARVEAESAEVERLLVAEGAREVRVARSPEEAELLWRARKQAFGALGRVLPNYLSYDAVVPRSRLPEALDRIAEIAAARGLGIANIFHAGDGNLHPTVLFDAGEVELTRRAREAGEAIVEACLAAEGVLTGEHGIGVTKREAMRLVCSTGELTLMDRVRRIFDPLCQLNPGKLLPEGEGKRERTATPDEARIVDAVRAAMETRRPLLPRGAGTLAVGPAQAALLPTAELRRFLRHDPADMTVTVEAGVTLAEIETRLAREGQSIAWEAPHPERATIGGIVAAGHWSSRALGTLHPKHTVLGLRAVTGEGELIEFGGRVMKNVTGYDVPKLLVGSRGTLAVVTRLILRTQPLAPHRAIARVEGGWDGLQAVAASLLETGAPFSRCDLLADGERASLMIGVEARTRAELAELASLLQREGASARWAQEDEADELRRTARGWLEWDRAAVILRLVASPGRARDLAARARAHCAEAGTGLRGWRLVASPGIGLVRLAIDPGFAEAPLRRLLLALAEEVRAAHGYRALDRAPAEQWWGWDPWGAPTELRERMRRIKIAFDPRGILAPWDAAG